jgi:AcrR family transcriptional regulator
MTKSDIIQAAFRVWGRELYHHTSLTQLARELGVTKPALYRHFHHKQALLDAMYDSFFDDYAAALKDAYDRALETEAPLERLLTLGRAMARYYCLNRDAFLFSLIRVYGNRDEGKMADQLLNRGMDLGKLRLGVFSGREEGAYPSPMQMTMVTLMFWITVFHRFEHPPEDAPSAEAVDAAIRRMEVKIRRGLGFNRDRVDALDYGELEKRLAAHVEIQEDGLFRAVAGAVAEAGPWAVSMDMVARRSGLSKSGLYAHFKNKQDMIRQFFLTEFRRIVASAEAGKAASAETEEQLYLTVFAIAGYLRSRPEILIAMDRIRTRKLELGFSTPPRMSWILSGIHLDALEGGEAGGEAGAEDSPLREWTSQCILFLIVNTLMYRPAGMDFSGVENENFRTLYRFLVLGFEGFSEATTPLQAAGHVVL